jgi:Fe-S-cluster containining protein
MTALTTQRLKRQDLPAGECLCSYCTARCCKYFALQIDQPTEEQDFDHLRWYMIHGKVSVFVEEGAWYLMIHNQCDHLQEDMRCGIYETRPNICRNYSTDNCEYDDDGVYDLYFETADQLHEYAVAFLPASNPRRFSASPPAPSEIRLPIASA